MDVANTPELGREDIRKIWNKPLIVGMRRYLRTGRKPVMKLPCYGCPHDPQSAESS